MAKRADAKPVGAAAAATAEDRLIDAALALAARQGWRQVSLREIAAAAGLSLAEAYALHPSKLSLIDALRCRVDRAVLAGPAADASESERDRLFDVLMRRFEALRPHRLGLASIARETLRDPPSLLPGMALPCSMLWMLEAAGLASSGWGSRLRAHVLTGVYLSTMRVFLHDDSADLSATMAALDRRLRQAERVLRLDATVTPAASA